VLKVAALAILGFLFAFGTSPCDVKAAEPNGPSGPEPRVAVAPFAPTSLGSDLRSRLEDAATAGLLATGAALTPKLEIAKAKQSSSLGMCADPTCLAQLARATDTPFWLRGNVTTEGNTYRIHLDIFNALENAVVAARDDSCEICTEADVAETTNVASSALKTAWRKAARPLLSDPPPIVDRNSPTTISITPEGSGRANSTSTTRPRWRRALSGALLGGGIIAAGAGAYFAYKNDSHAPGDRLYDTKGLAIASFATAAVLVGAGVTLFVLPSARTEGSTRTGSPSTANTTAALTWTGAGLFVHGSF